MANRNIQIGFGVPQGGILAGDGRTIVDFEIFMRSGLGSFSISDNSNCNGHKIDLFKPLDFIPVRPRMRARADLVKLNRGFAEGWFT